MPGSPTSPAGALEYHQLHRAGYSGVWQPIVGCVLLVAVVFVAVPFGLLIPFGAYYVATGSPLEQSILALLDVEEPTPAGLAYLNLSLASAIPATWFLTRFLHGLKPRWLASVRPQIRWAYFFACIGLSVVSLVATLLVSLLLPAQGGTEITGEVNEFTRQTRDFLLVVLFLTPFQAAGEEYFFRGYLTQAFGGLFDRLGPTVGKVLAVVGPAVLFALAHGLGQSVPIFFDRLAFGLVAGVLVILTGGLEAGIAMHVLNNFLAFGIALAFADMGSALNPTGGSWWSIPVTLTQSVVYLALAVVVGRAMGLRATADPAVLAASGGPVYRFPSARA
jgi:membrane protease YdiL (CAAX protease family)